MQCKILGCKHTKSRRANMVSISSWTYDQICPCCSNILIEMGVFPQNLFVSNPQRCKNEIEKWKSNIKKLELLIKRG